MHIVPLAQVRYSPGELTERFGIQFTESDEDFDTSDSAVVELRSGVRCIFVRHRQNPFPGTAVMVEEGRNLRGLLPDFLAGMGFEETDVTWLPFD
jgi:hypothetical protein